MGQDNTDNSHGGYGGYSGYSGSSSSSSSQPNDASSSSGQSGHSAQQYGYGTGQAGSQQYGQAGSSQQQQTYSSSATYEPPASAQGTSPHDPTSTGLQAKTEALVSYLLWWVGGLIFLVVERKNRFVRFSAAQSFIFFGGVSLLYLLLQLISIIPLLGFLLNPVTNCASFVIGIPALLIWLFLMVQAYRGVTVRLPIISGYADSLVNRLTPKKKRTV